MVTRKQLKDKYNVVFWKEYDYSLKCKVWICVTGDYGEYVCQGKTLKEIEDNLKIS